MKVIGVTGVARCGKDTFCTIAKEILAKNNYRAKHYCFANKLKEEVAPFLRDMCKVDAWTNDSATKVDLRDFLVWYGTTWWRKRDPKRWIRAVDLEIKSDMNDVEIALVGDVRYLNEADWVHSWGGYMVHIAAYKMDEELTPNLYEGEKYATVKVKNYISAPNEQERINDPIVKGASDYMLQWEMKNISTKDVLKDKDLQAEVLKGLNSISWFNESLQL